MALRCSCCTVLASITESRSGPDGVRKIMVASLRYLDTFTKISGAWCFAERNLIVDWSETRSLKAPSAV